FGAAADMRVGATSAGVHKSLLRFDLGFITPHTQITRATMVLWSGTCCSGADVRVHAVTAPWDESTVTWQSFDGAYDAAVAATLPTCTAPALLDVTSLVTAWHTDAATNFGMLLEQDPTVGTFFPSSDSPFGLDRPGLRICYNVEACP